METREENSPILKPSIYEQPFAGSRLWKYGLKIAAGILLVLLSVLFLGPFLFSISQSLKGFKEIYLFPPTLFPKEWRFDNYIEIWRIAPLSRFYANTILVTVLATLGSMISCTVVAYGFARFQFPGKNILFFLVLSTLILPEEVMLVSRFLLFKKFNWLDTFLPLIVPSFLGVNSFFIFLLRQFIMSIPRELDEAAELDGASTFRILWNVILPLITPALATVAIFAFLYNWNDFINPLIYLSSTNNFTLSLGLRFYENLPESGAKPMQAYLLAASIIATIPPIIIFLLAQPYYIRGVILSGLKL